MLVRITAKPTQRSVDGIPLSQFKLGSVYALPIPLATLFIVEQWAEPVVDASACTLPEIVFRIFPRPERQRRLLTPKGPRSRLGLAADRRRRSD